MARLVATVYVHDPEKHETVRLDAGSEPEPRLAALVTNPSAWEDGKPPAAEKKTATKSAAADSGDGDKPAASKKAATSPARGRKAAGEGSSG